MAKSHADMLGMRRISWVHVVRNGDDATAEVHGIGHRLPRTIRVPMATASALVAAGVPLVLQDSSSPSTNGTP